MSTTIDEKVRAAEEVEAVVSELEEIANLPSTLDDAFPFFGVASAGPCASTSRCHTRGKGSTRSRTSGAATCRTPWGLRASSGR